MGDEERIPSPTSAIPDRRCTSSAIFLMRFSFGMRRHSGFEPSKPPRPLTSNADRLPWGRVVSNCLRAVVSVAMGTVEANFVIDATGQTGLISRQLGLRWVDDAFRFLALWGYYEGSDFMGIEGEVHPGSELGAHRPVTVIASLDEAGDEGWAWHIILRDRASVGLVIPTDVAKKTRRTGEPWAEFFARRVRQVPSLGDLLTGATLIPGSVSSIRNYSSRSKQLSGPGFFLAGDAAGFVDPIFSVGVVLGMYSGMAVAWAADRVIRKPDSAKSVRAIFDNQLEGRIEVARTLALPRYHPERDVSDIARRAVQFEHSAVKELMFVVSMFTTRNDNWLDLVGGVPPDLREGQLKELDDSGSSPRDPVHSNDD